MKTAIAFFVSFLALELLGFSVGCATPGPTPAPTPVPGPTDYTEVCQHLADIGCAEGAAPECAVAFQRFQNGRMVDFDVSCLWRAQTPAEARACGSVLCE